MSHFHCNSLYYTISLPPQYIPFITIIFYHLHSYINRSFLNWSFIFIFFYYLNIKKCTCSNILEYFYSLNEFDSFWRLPLVFFLKTFYNKIVLNFS